MQKETGLLVFGVREQPISVIDRYCDKQLTALQEAVQKDVTGHDDVNPDSSGKRCRDTCECYADLHWQNSPLFGMYEADLVDPACERVCAGLGEFELTALLAWRWDEYLNGNDPGVKCLWRMPLASRRNALVFLLREAISQEANSDGAAIEDRVHFSEDTKDE